MKKLVLLFLLLSSYAFSQSNCELCAEQGGFYCGDDESNWTSYSPLGCVPNGLNGVFYLNDGWSDCVDGSDEDNAAPTTLGDCNAYGETCDTVFIEIPIIQYEIIFDTIIQTEYLTQIVIDTLEIETLVPEYIYITDTVYAEVLDTMYVDVIEYVDTIVYDTVVEIEYVEFIITEYLDCLTGLPCNTAILELDKSKLNNNLYNLMGDEIRKPNGIYIENGEIKFKIN
tara:strand:+ start:597 stop:1277 length:681 start_codon:yes stop_codon:yes gene_type:complete